jgi:hypothetical protein
LRKKNNFPQQASRRNSSYQNFVLQQNFACLLPVVRHAKKTPKFIDNLTKIITMDFRLLIFCTLTFCLTLTKVQSQTDTNKDFSLYAKTQDNLMHKAYEQRDTKTYTEILGEFESKYEKLSAEDKAYFRGNYINSIYNLSCTYSLLNEKTKALEYLDKSIKVGYNNYAHIKADTDLDNIRNEEVYNKILQSLLDRKRETRDYLYILKKAKHYNDNENIELPKFTYQTARNPNLEALRKAFNLDSIAGQGNEVSKILSLLHWIHNLVPHDGNHDNPVVKNAMSMISVCKKDKRGLNCRGLATVLNECYLSMGIKSRFITCLPKDSLGIDNDCHVINMVYSKQLKKWLWIDPTNDAYVMDEKNDLLSIEEVRERLINGKPLILNTDANWNHKVSIIKENYLYNYMAKNLYILECPLNSEYDLETKSENKTINYLRLIPAEYFKKSLEKIIVKDDKSKSKIVINKTNNSNIFWQIP